MKLWRRELNKHEIKVVMAGKDLLFDELTKECGCVPQGNTS